MKSVLCGLVLAAVAASLNAQDPDDPSPHSDATLLSEQAAIRAGEPFTVALRLTMEEGWHSYWKNPGDAGSATIIDWDLPAGFEVGEIQWPYPHYIEQPPLASYGYDNEVLLLIDVVPPENLTAGQTARLAAVADWVVCERICLPAMANLSLDLPVTDGPATTDSRWQRQFTKTRQMLPIESREWETMAWTVGTGLVLELHPPSSWDGRLTEMHFFASDLNVIAYAAPQTVSVVDGAFRIRLVSSEYAVAVPERLTGVVVAPDGETWDGAARALAVDVPVGLPPALGSASGGGITLAVALLFALIGGLLLNLMPCVFPVLSIKILGIVESGGANAASVRRHGLAFAIGVVGTFWALAAVLLFFRAGGTRLGWGFQLQSPLFVASLAGLFLIIALNLLGVFEVGMAFTRVGGRVGQPSGYSGSVASGVLATVAATPCIAPFMGAALGFALSQSAVTTSLVFGILGLGMALPYIALTMVPSLIQALPRPGQWMETLRQLLAFPLFATAAWLVWVFGRQTSVDGSFYLVLALLLLSFCVWIVGRWNRLATTRRTYFVTRTFALVSFVAAVALATKGTRTVEIQQEAAGGWEPWSVAAVVSHQAAGRSVFVDFTADWCLTCKVNERVVLAASQIESAFEEHEVVLLKADWTRRDPTISQALESFGVGGVPLYVLYPADPAEPPRVLPVILTKSIVLDALQDL